MRSKPHLEHLLFCPPCLRIADGVLESPLNVPDYHFWLVRQVVDDQTIHFIGDEGNRQITVRFLDTFQITSMLCNNRMSVFVTGNKIYTVGCRITSVMVAQDARKGRRVLDRFGPSGGGNTLRPVCGYIIPVLECGGMCLATELCTL